MKKVLLLVVGSVTALSVARRGDGQEVPAAGESTTSSSTLTVLARGDGQEVPAAVEPSRVMGAKACFVCHPSEVEAWSRTRHAEGIYNLHFRTNTPKYADELGIPLSNVGHHRLCAGCHGTLADRDGRVERISGVSCESCHGASGGADGWLNAHGSYGPPNVPREQETPEHRRERIVRIEEAGMVRNDSIYASAKKCFGCHLVPNQKLVEAGHPLTNKAGFELVSWTSGEVRHNFFLDRHHNSPAPTLHALVSGQTLPQRRRIMYVVGRLVDLEVTFRNIAAAEPGTAYLGDLIAHADIVFGSIEELLDFGVAAAAEVIAEFDDVFDVLPDGKDSAERIGAAADKIGSIARRFEVDHDGSGLAKLDEIIPARGVGAVYEPPGR